MADKRASGRSLDEWMDLVTECRQSGLTDAAWCNEHGISRAVFTMRLPVFVKRSADTHEQRCAACSFEALLDALKEPLC